MRVLSLIVYFGNLFAMIRSKAGEVCFPFGSVQENNSEAVTQGRPGKIGPRGLPGPQGMIGPPGPCNCNEELRQMQGL